MNIKVTIIVKIDFLMAIILPCNYNTQISNTFFQCNMMFLSMSPLIIRICCKLISLCNIASKNENNKLIIQICKCIKEH